MAALVVAVSGPSGQASVATTSVAAEADAYVVQNQASRNFGTSTQLRLGASPTQRTYLRFNVAGVVGTVVKATLTVTSTSASTVPVSATGVSNTTWGERTITYSNAPALGASPTSTFGSFAANQAVSFDVTPLVAGNGRVSIALTTANAATVSFASREAGTASAPQLVIQATTDVRPANTAAPTIGGTAGDGKTLTASTGTWSGTQPITYAYQWQRCNSGGALCANLSGATGQTYTLGSSDIGSTMKVAVTAANTLTATALSAQTAVVTATRPTNTVAPTITGTPQASQTLTAGPGTWSGTQPITYAYQWLRCNAAGASCASVAGATGQTYLLSSGDVGSTIAVTVTATNSGGSTSASAPATAVVTGLPTAPTNTQLPSISGSAQAGQSLAASTGSWTGTQPITYGFQWQRCDTSGANCASIASATAQSYVATPLDVGSTVRVNVTAANVVGPVSAVSAQTPVVTAAPVGPTNTSLPTVSGTAQEAQTLTAGPGSWSGTQPIGYAYQWQRCDASGANCALVGGATVQTYTATTTDVGSTLRILVTASNTVGSTPASSAATATVSAAPAAPTNTSLPTVSGTAQEAQTLTAGPGSWSGTQPIGYAYQWQRCDASGANCALVGGATVQTYTATTTDVGSTLRILVTASNTGGNVPATSAQSAVVAAAATQPANTSPPTVAGSVVVGQSLSAGVGSWSGSLPITYAYQWQRCDSGGVNCAPIGGATGQSYVLVAADLAATIRVAVTATNAVASASAVSAQTVVVTNGSGGCSPRSSSYSSTILGTPGVVGYWRLGEAAGTVACDSKGSNNGAYQAGTTLGQPGALANDPDTAVAFNGTSGWVSVASNTSLNVADTFSIEAWVKRGAIGGSVNQVIAAKQANSWVLMFNPSNQLVLRKSGVADVVASTATITDTSGWHYVAATKAGATVKLYIDGADVTGTVTNQTMADNTQPLAIGQSSTSAYFNGSIDEVALYNVALTPTQITNRAGLPPVNTSPPTVAGSVVVGQSLSAGVGSWSGSLPITYAYQWQRCDSGGVNCAPIGGATGQSYVLVAADLAATIRVAVTATNAVASASAVSAQTVVVTNGSGGCSPRSSSYSSTILGTPGVVGYWRLGEAAGTVACDSKGSNNGAYQAGTTLGQPGALANDPDTAVAFNGTSGWVSVASNTSLNVADTFSIEAWVKRGAIGGSVNQVIAAKQANSWVLMFNPSNQLVLRKSGVADVVASTATITDTSGWHYVAATKAGATVKLYIDGADVTGTVTNQTMADNTQPLAIGQSSTSAYFNGSIDEVALYNVALTPTQITNRAGLPPVNTSPPTVSGTLQAGATLTSSTGTWSGLVSSYATQWRRCTSTGSPCSNIPAATGTSYVLTTADVGSTIVVGVTATGPGGSNTASSTATAAIAPSSVVSGDPLIATAGDIACDPASAAFNSGLGTATACAQQATSNLLVGQSLAGVLALGDDQYECGGYSAFLQSYDPSWGRFKSITHPVPGNHEYASSGGTGCDPTGQAGGYFQYFGAAAGDPGKGYYSYDIGSWHLIALNSNCSFVGGCGAGSPQETWLKGDLAAHPATCTLAYWHHPLFTTDGTVGNDTEMTVFWQDLYAAGADVVLSGHAHTYERFAPQDSSAAYDPTRGIREFVVGTGGEDFHPFSSTNPLLEARQNQAFGVLMLTLHATSYSWSFTPALGGTFSDSGSTYCH